MIDQEGKSLKIDTEDEIVAGTLICRDGKIVHPAVAPAAAKKPGGGKAPAKRSAAKKKPAGKRKAKGE
jgi:NAD(P) transhydrogenase subunit alpha